MTDPSPEMVEAARKYWHSEYPPTRLDNIVTDTMAAFAQMAVEETCKICAATPTTMKLVAAVLKRRILEGK